MMLAFCCVIPSEAGKEPFASDFAFYFRATWRVQRTGETSDQGEGRWGLPDWLSIHEQTDYIEEILAAWSLQLPKSA